MQYRACDLCGCLVGSAAAPIPGESLICDECLRTRRVRYEPEALDEPRHPKHTHKFPCLYCGRKLRSKPVKREVALQCPACGGLLVLEPGGFARRAEPAAESPEEEEESASGSSESGLLLRQHETQDPDRDAAWPPPAGAFGTQPASAFGTQPASAFGTQPASAFGTQPASAFGTQPASAFGTQPAGAFGTQPAQDDLALRERRPSAAGRVPDRRPSA